MHFCKFYAKLPPMNVTKDIKISPVNIKERADLGIKTGDTVRVWIKIEEKGKIRLQPFEGLVIATKHGKEPGATFTVRKVASGVGVEKIFPLYSPVIDKIEILKRARVRRAKLYFVRDIVARKLRRVLRKSQEVNIATKGAAELEEERKRAEEEQKRLEEEQKKQQEQEQQEKAQEAEQNESEQSQEESQSQEEAQDKENNQEQTQDQNEAQEDDLTKIEGIGPKIASVLAENGITTFAKLAEAKDEDIQEMIKDVPGNHKADTWNEQAALARDGKWDELKKLQEKLDGGVVKNEDAKEALEKVEK